MIFGLQVVLAILGSGSFTLIAAFTSAAAAQEKIAVEVVQQIGHTSFVNSVAFSPDGRFVLSSSDDRTLKLWDVATGKELRSFSGRGPVAFSPDSRFILSGNLDKTLKLWDVATGKKLRSFSVNTHDVESVAFSPDGRFVLSGGCDRRDANDIFVCIKVSMKLWDEATGKQLRSFMGHTSWVRSAVFSPDGRFALSGSDDTTLKLWDVATGKELRSFWGHTSRVWSVAFSPDGRFALSGGCDATDAQQDDKCIQGAMKLWDVTTGEELRSFSGHTGWITSVAFSPDGRFVISGSYDKTIKLWEVATGKELRSFSGHTATVPSIAFSPDGLFVLSGSYDNTLKLWDAATGRELRTFKGHTNSVRSVAFSPNSRFVLSGTADKTVKLWDVTAGRELRSFSGHRGFVVSVAFSPDGRLAISAGDNTVKLFELATGKELHSFRGSIEAVTSAAFSPDGLMVLTGGCDKYDENSCNEGSMRLWEVATGKEVHNFSAQNAMGLVSSVAFSPDGRFALSGSCDSYGGKEVLFLCIKGSMKLWEISTGKELRNFSGHTSDVRSVTFSPNGRFALSAGSWDKTMKLWDVATGKELRTFSGHTAFVWSVAFSPNGRFALSGGEDSTIRLWDVTTGKQLRSFRHAGAVHSLAFSSDGRFALSGSEDGTVRIWDIGNSTELARMFGSPDDEWLTITPSGFFSGSHRDTAMLALVRGVETTTIGQVQQSLFNPDLVREALAGDPGGAVKRAAEIINLEKVLESGPPPLVTVTSPLSESQSARDLVTVTARVTDRGKGIGRIEWRVNGITAGVSGVPAGAGPDYEMKRQLALDAGENKIEVIAYNARNLLASLPARTTIAYTGPADGVKPNLYILAIGINKYVDRGGFLPGTNVAAYFPELQLAVGDANSLVDEVQRAGAGLYGRVRIKKVLDEGATADRLDQAVEEIAAEIQPRDTFVLFAAAHGYSVKESGRFYLIPQDYQGGPAPDALAERAIGQDRLQNWIANRIKAKKAIILLDTCESGALVNGYPASETAIGRLHEATGRPVLTAAASGQSALETDELGHGVFTAALIEALHKGDSNGNGKIEISELAAYVETRVPELAAHIGELAAIKGIRKGASAKGGARAAIAMRGFKDDRQSAHFGSTGEDFAIVNRLP